MPCFYRHTIMKRLSAYAINRKSPVKSVIQISPTVWPMAICMNCQKDGIVQHGRFHYHRQRNDPYEGARFLRAIGLNLISHGMNRTDMNALANRSWRKWNSFDNNLETYHFKQVGIPRPDRPLDEYGCHQSPINDTEACAIFVDASEFKVLTCPERKIPIHRH